MYLRNGKPSFMTLSRRKGRQTRPEVRLLSHKDSNKIGFVLRSFLRGTFHFRPTPQKHQHKTIPFTLRQWIWEASCLVL